MGRTTYTFRRLEVLLRMSSVLLLVVALVQRVTFIPVDHGEVVAIALSQTSEVDIQVWWQPQLQVSVWRQEDGWNWRVVP